MVTIHHTHPNPYRYYNIRDVVKQTHWYELKTQKTPLVELQPSVTFLI